MKGAADKLVIQPIGSGNKSRAQPWRTLVDIGNQSDIWPSTLTQLTKVAYRFSRSSVNFAPQNIRFRIKPVRFFSDNLFTKLSEWASMVQRHQKVSVTICT